MTNDVTPKDRDALLKAIPLQVHRKTDYPPMNAQLSKIFDELKRLRKEEKIQLRKAKRVKKHLDVLILDLWIAANYSENPWRFISLDRNDYTKGTRYRKIYLKYDLFRRVLFNLVSLEYIDLKKGFWDRKSNKRFQTRIKASDKLLNLLKFDIQKITRDPEAPEEEIIIRRDENKNNIDYVDDKITIQMRGDLRRYNELLRNTHIDTDGIDLRYKYDPTNITVKRIFDRDDNGGRFYCGFWENMPKEDRLKLKINGEEVCELDFSTHHPMITYALKEIPVEGDLYAIEGCKREEVKKAFIILFNCKSRQHALNTMRSELHIKNAESLLQKIEQKHQAISDKFYDPWHGMYLQAFDAWLTDNIINKFTDKGIACLPIHDSYLVAKKYKEELHSVMERLFFNTFNIKPIIK